MNVQRELTTLLSAVIGILKIIFLSFPRNIFIKKMYQEVVKSLLVDR